MSYLMIPHGVSSTSATVWLAGINESLDPVEVIVTPASGEYHSLPQNRKQWRSQNGMYTLDYRRDALTNLQPRSTHALELRVGGQHRAECEFTTLPARLPTFAEKPFTLMLGSCFYADRDASGKLGNTYFNLPAGEQPDVKLWCGDQVYLDAPWHHYTLHTHDPAELEVRHFETYARAWSQTGTAQGFHYALKRGANYFSADDHEFWNNAPYWTTLIRDSWTEEGRRRWWDIAHTLFQAFQTDDPTPRFNVPPLSFFIADTRINRNADLNPGGSQRCFMRPEDLKELSAWVRNLSGPGVLSVGQPLFTTRAGFWGKFARKFSDWKLPDYDQYPELVRILSESQHSIVILTGDVHYGRIASVPLRSGLELIEIISSPTSLVDDNVGKKWGPPPEVYPSFDIPGVAKGLVRTQPGFQLVENHFLTLQFSATGSQVRLTVKAWPIIDPGVAPRAQIVYERLLQ